MEAFPMSQPLNYNIRHQPTFSTRPVKNVYCGKKTFDCLEPKI